MRQKHGNVDDDLAFPDEVLGQAVQNTGCGDDDVSLTADSSGINSTGVADGNGSVLLHQHHSSGLADYQGAADNDSLLALAVYNLTPVRITLIKSTTNIGKN